MENWIFQPLSIFNNRQQASTLRRVKFLIVFPSVLLAVIAYLCPENVRNFQAINEPLLLAWVGVIILQNAPSHRLCKSFQEIIQSSGKGSHPSQPKKKASPNGEALFFGGGGIRTLGT